jgi:hypothetical protein
MATQKAKYGKSQFKYVQQIATKTDKNYWMITLQGVQRKTYNTEREAAIAVDKYLISKGKEPLNILVRKSV